MSLRLMLVAHYGNFFDLLLTSISQNNLLFCGPLMHRLAFIHRLHITYLPGSLSSSGVLLLNQIQREEVLKSLGVIRVAYTLNRVH